MYFWYSPNFGISSGLGVISLPGVERYLISVFPFLEQRPLFVLNRYLFKSKYVFMSINISFTLIMVSSMQMANEILVTRVTAPRSFFLDLCPWKI